MDKLTQSLQHLVPEGFAWPRDTNSVLMRVISGLAAAYGDLSSLIEATSVAWRPQEATARLAEWESAVGLPDACFGPDQNRDARRNRLVARLRGAEGHFLDSSPASPDAIAAICRNLGFPASVAYNTPFRVGRDRSGNRVGRLNGVLNARLVSTSTRFRVAGARVGARLVERPPDAVALACYLQKYIPARFQLSITFED